MLFPWSCSTNLRKSSSTRLSRRHRETFTDYERVPAIIDQISKNQEKDVDRIRIRKFFEKIQRIISVAVEFQGEKIFLAKKQKKSHFSLK